MPLMFATLIIATNPVAVIGLHTAFFYLACSKYTVFIEAQEIVCNTVRGVEGVSFL
jgi:hypothetical protein